MCHAMRLAIFAALFICSSWLTAIAQPPTTANDPTKLVIRPGGKGAEPIDSIPDKDGFIVIRPNGKGLTTIQTSQPTQPQPKLVQVPAAAAMNVPPPGPQPKEAKDGKPLFEYWFAVGV